MKKMLKNCFLIICYMAIFLSKTVAAPWDEFCQSFIDITHEFEYNFDLEQMASIDVFVDEMLLESKDGERARKLMRKYGISTEQKEGELNLPYEIFKTQFMVQLAKAEMIPNKLVCRHFAFYFSGVLTEHNIKNWVLLIPLPKSETTDGHMVNLYVDPRDNELYVADGAGQASLNAGKISFDPHTLAGFLIEQARRKGQDTLNTFFLRQPLGFFIKHAYLPLQKDKFGYIDGYTGKSMSYEEFNEDYSKYVSEHPLDKK